MYAWLTAAVADDAEIVTATSRLARDLRSVHDGRQAALGHGAWKSPAILPWSAWLRTLAVRAPLSSDRPLLLEPAASAVVWERTLRAAAGERLLNASGLARQMRETWQRLQDWCVSAADLGADTASDDQRLFADVAAAYGRELEARGWTDAAGLTALCERMIADGRIVAPRRMVHSGFDRLPPAAERLLAALARAGCDVSAAPRGDRRRAVQVVAAADGDAELRAAGAWARSRLAANPAARVAVVRAGLESDPSRAARLLREGAAPGWQYGDRERLEAVDVAHGRRLGEYPMVAVALLWLKWVQRGLSAREVSVLLRSPFAGSGSADTRHAQELRLRRLPDREWPADDLAAALDGAAGIALDAVIELADEADDALPPAQWAERIDGFLERLGWPGEASLDSAEFQLRDRWRELLNEFSLLEPVRPLLRFGEAFARLSALAAETVFQPEAEGAAVRLLGPLEAAGLEFDDVWLANLQAMQWPPPAGPLPLVSRSLQRRFGMPDAVPADTLEHAGRILGRIAGSADTVVMSWPSAERDAELVPSPLLDRYRERPTGRARDPGWFAAGLAGGERSRVSPDPAPPIRPGERVTGGAYTLRCQLAEPFAAFAHGRLGARTLPAIEAGVSAGLRGRIVHAALAGLLSARPSRDDLRAWPVEERSRRIAAAAEQALAAPSRHADAVVTRLLALERQRLVTLLGTLLAEESARAPFRIEGVEQAVDFERHGVALKLRIDRIDRLPDGSLVVVDYKTGAVKNLLTGAGAPAEWQTVVYAAALDAAVGGLLLINVDSRGIVYRGAGAGLAGTAIEPGEWAVRLDGWLRQVDGAIRGLAAGDARIDAARAARERGPLDILSRAATPGHET